MIARELAFTKNTRIEFAHGQATKASRKMTNTLTDALLCHRDTLSTVLAWVWITILHPIFRRCYQFHFIVYVFFCNVVVVFKAMKKRKKSNKKSIKKKIFIHAWKQNFLVFQTWALLWPKKSVGRYFNASHTVLYFLYLNHVELCSYITMDQAEAC